MLNAHENLKSKVRRIHPVRAYKTKAYTTHQKPNAHLDPSCGLYLLLSQLQHWGPRSILNLVVLSSCLFQLAAY